MATNKDLVTGLYVAIYDRAPDQAGRDGWLSALDAGTYNATTMAAEFIKAAPTKFSELYDGKTNEQIVQAAYNNILGRNGEDAGVANWTAFLDANGQDAFFASFVTSALDYDPAADTTSDAATKAAATTAQQALSNKVEAGNYFADTLGTKSNGAIDSDIYNQSVSLLNGVTEDAATLAAARATVDQLNTDTPDPGVDGAKFYLTSGTDEASDFAFSDNNDTFLAYLQQNSLVGGVSNSLSSADRLDGGAGSDSLYAELVTEFYGVNGNNAIDVQARTSSIENVTFQARDMSAGGGSVTVDAKHMTDIVKIGSVQSDGDLVIENLTTLTSAGALRNTESITVTMDHTDNFNSDGDASDLTVYFDEDYLLAGRIEDSNTVQYEVMNQDAWDLINLSGRDDVQLLDGVVFQHLSFVLNGSTVDLTSALNENGDDLAIRTHQDLADAINTALTGLGLDNQVNAVVGPNFTERTAVQTGDERSAPTVQLVGQPGVELSATEDNAFLAPVSEAEREIPASNRYDRAAVSTNDGRDEDVTVNVELHKVGREGEGGNLMIGGKSNDAAEGNGVQVFNISVLGDATKPSNLGQITSTNGALQTINIVTDAAFVNGDTHASLTVRGEDMQSTSNVTDTDAAPFGGNVAKVDASGFLGNLSLGNETRVDNLGELVATGGGDVSYWAVSTDTITTGNGNDYINEVNSGASITSGAGNDQIVADADANMTINAGTGDDTVDLLSEETGAAADVGADAVADQNTVTVDLGAGNDTLMDNNEHVVVNSGAGNDALYLENTGTKGVAANVNLAQDFGTSDAFADNVEDGYQLLLGRTVTVTFNGDQGVNNGNVEAYTDGFEATATVQAGELTDVAGNSYSSLTSKADLGNAIESAVNNSDVLSKLVSFDKATFTFTSLVDGSDNQVEVRIGDTNWSAATQDAIETEYQRYVDDSDATVNNSYVGYAVDSALAGGADSTDSSDNTVVIAAGMDVAQLSTDSTSTDTIQFTTQDFGTTYINNFDGNDVLDFSAFLNDQNSSSGSADSAELIAITAGNDLNVAANEVTNLNFSPVANVPTWNDLTEANLLEAFNLTNSTYSNQQLFGGTGHSVVMVENNANAGEYKVFYVTFDGTTANSVTASSIDYKGTVDFGASGAAIESGVALANAGGSTETGGTVTPTPTYALASSAQSVNEGESVTFTLNTTNVAAGEAVNFTIAGITADDLPAGQTLPTQFTVEADGSTDVTINLREDVTTEGDETLTLTLDDVANVSGSVTVVDSSQGSTAPTPTYALASSAQSVNEGQSVTFTLNTTNVAAGETVNFTIAGITADDLPAGQTLPTQFTVEADGSTDVTINLREDATTEGDETLTLTLDDVANVSGSVTVVDSSQTPAAGGQTDVSADQGTPTVPAALDAGTDTFRFTDDADVAGSVVISNFANGDTIAVSNAAATDYTFSNNGDDVTITYNNNGTLNSIQLIDVVDAASDLVFNEASFEQAIGFDAFLIV